MDEAPGVVGEGARTFGGLVGSGTPWGQCLRDC
jgi:hypothetical protein